MAVVFLALAAAVPARGQGDNEQETAPALEARLPGLQGEERARVLQRLVELYEDENPKRAVELGQEAQRLFTAHPDPERQTTLLIDMAWAFMKLGEYDQAREHAEQGRDLALGRGDRLRTARALSNLGTLAQRRGEPTVAIERFSEALALQQALGHDEDMAMSLNNLGFVYSADLADYDLALEHHLKALEVRERLGRKADIALSLNNIGIVYQRLRQLDLALSYYEKALVLRRELGLKNRVSGTLQNLGDLYLEQGKLEAALASHLEAFEIRKGLGDRFALSVSHRSLGGVYLKMKRPEAARRHLDEALRLGRETGDKPLAVGNLLALAEYDRDRSNAASAERRAHEALQIAKSTQALELERRALGELALSQEMGGRFEAALSTQKELKRVSDLIFDENKSRRVASLERRYELEKREREIARLRTEQALQELEVNRRTLQRNTLAGTTLLLGFVGFAAYKRRVEKARLAEELSVTDALTGLKNRRYVSQTMPPDVAASLRLHRAALGRGGSPENADLLFMLVDIDHFKAINDEHGHAAGDLVLAQLGQVLKLACRESDTVARWGGEEFLVVGRFTDRAQGAAQAERLRQSVAAHVFRLAAGRSVPVTCSIGYAAFPFTPASAEPLDWSRVVDLADHAAYAAKRAGRNGWLGLSHGSGDLPDGALFPANLEAWIREGRLRVSASAQSPAPAV
ncbi:MAG TPA: tetratricopeptide repeat protein [Vicinamibacteria bacterium]